MIKKRNGKYVLYTKDGKRVLGTHNTAREAHAQEYAIEKSMEKKAVLGPEGTILGAAIGRSLGSTDEEKARAAAFGGAAAMGAGYAALPYVFTPAIESLLTKRDLAEFNRGLQRPGLVNKAKTYGEAAGKIFNAGNLLKLKSPFSYVQQHKSGLDVLKGIASIYPRGLAVAGTAGLLGGLLGKYTADTEKTSSERLRTTVFGLDNEGKLLHGFSNKGYYKFPGGTVEPGEDLLESAKRELLEEAGYEVDSIEELPIASTLSSGGQRHGGADAVSRTKYLLARLGQRNATQLGADGDAISSLSTAPIPEVIDGLVGDEMFGYQVAGQNRAALEKLRDIIAGREKTSSDQQDVYVQSAVPTKYLELLKRKGLASQKAIAKDPELLKAFLDVRNLSEEKFRADLAERLENNFWNPAVSGPSVFFTSPDPDKVSDPRHFINQFKTSPVKINLSRLIRDMPDTRIAGSELVPYDPDGPEHQGDIRHRDITLEQAAEYARTDPKELWKNYKPEYVGKYYAADVPHAQIVTPSGVIPPEYLEVEKTSSAKEQLKHILVTGHSGAGKSTYAKELSEQLGMPLHRLDSRAKEIIAEDYPDYEGVGWPGDLSERVVSEALALKYPHIIEGTQMLEVPDLGGDLRRILVDTPENRIVEQRASREYEKRKLKNKPYRPMSSHRDAAQKLVEHYRDAVDSFRNRPGVESVVPEVKEASSPLYHGSPADVEELVPSQATGKGSEEHRRKAVYATKDPREALLYAIMSRPNTGGYALADGKAHYVEGRPLNERGYVYELPEVDYTNPEDPRAGIALERSVRPVSRREVTLDDARDLLVSYPTKEEYKSAVRELMSKSASDSDFTPDLSPDQLKSLGVYDQVYGDAPSEASMKEWPESWINEQDPLGWLQWYERYSKGRRTDDDARQIKRWKSFKARHLAQYLKNPTKRRAAALRNWGVDVKQYPSKEDLTKTSIARLATAIKGAKGLVGKATKGFKPTPPPAASKVTNLPNKVPTRGRTQVGTNPNLQRGSPVSSAELSNQTPGFQAPAPLAPPTRLERAGMGIINARNNAPPGLGPFVDTLQDFIAMKVGGYTPKEDLASAIKTAKEKGTATKRDPKKWAAAKARAKAKMGGKWSARAAQLAVKYYKDAGGGYEGKKPTASNNKLKKWTKQDWQWSGDVKREQKEKSGEKKSELISAILEKEAGKGVYLPRRAISQLSKKKLEKAEANKRRATNRGEQYSTHGLHEGKNRSKLGADLSKEKSALRDLIRGRKLDTDAEPALDVVKMSYFDDVADPDNVRPIDRQERLRGFSQTASDPQYMRPKTPKTNESVEDSSTNLYNRIGNQDYNQFGEKAVSRLGNLGAYR